MNEGEASNYGIELTLEKFYSKFFYFLLTTSFFKSQYKASNGGTFSTKFDTGYIGNLLAGKEFSLSENKKIIIDLKATLAGGRRYTPIDLEASNSISQTVFVPDQTFALQHKPYFRTDFKITFRLDRPKVSHEVFLNVDNVFNINNIFATYYNPLAQDVVTINQLGMFPIFQYRVEF